jgi:hypothetical protein
MKEEEKTEEKKDEKLEKLNLQNLITQAQQDVSIENARCIKCETK